MFEFSPMMIGSRSPLKVVLNQILEFFLSSTRPIITALGATQLPGSIFGVCPFKIVNHNIAVM
jgi:hypothetical protein